MWGIAKYRTPLTKEDSFAKIHVKGQKNRDEGYRSIFDIDYAIVTSNGSNGGMGLNESFCKEFGMKADRVNRNSSSILPSVPDEIDYKSCICNPAKRVKKPD